MTLQQPGVKPSGHHLATDPTNAQADEATSDPAARPGCALTQLPAPRLAKPPVDDRDLEERTDVRATSSKDALELHVEWGNHVNHMEWQRTLRDLVPYAGPLGLGVVAACLHRYLGLPLGATTEITAGGILAAGGGVTARILASVWRRRGPRHQRDRDSSSL